MVHVIKLVIQMDKGLNIGIGLSLLVLKHDGGHFVAQ